MGVQRVRDPVYGLVVFGGGSDPYQRETDCIAWRLINTREFQRLRRIRQLGFSDLVYPGATHSRFSHSIGVYHMARRLIGVITRCVGEEARNHERERVALLAALLHDTGHGPFSHVFEAVTKAIDQTKRHEQWSADIVQDDQTNIHCVLRDEDASLPERVSRLFKEEEPLDIYSTVVSSQFDADRLDYIQRDRLMVGVGFGHFDQDWLLDCLEVGTVTIDRTELDVAPCFYLGPKGVSVAEEYIEARYRLYRMVYMHKTTRAAEKMLEELLKAVATHMSDSDLADREPLLRYFNEKSLHNYLELDDSTIWAALSAYSEQDNDQIATLAKRLRRRCLYKCVEVYDDQNTSRFLRIKRGLNCDQEWAGKVYIDEPTITPYKWYDFEDRTALNKVLVKKSYTDIEPNDIANESKIVKVLRDTEHIQRLYVPSQELAERLQIFVEETQR